MSVALVTKRVMSYSQEEGNAVFTIRYMVKGIYSAVHY